MDEKMDKEEELEQAIKYMNMKENKPDDSEGEKRRLSALSCSTPNPKRAKLTTVDKTGTDASDLPPQLSFELPKSRDLPNKLTDWKHVELPVDILLLTVDDCEFLGCYYYLKKPLKSYYKDTGPVYFGSMGSDSNKTLKIALMKCSKGSAVPGGSLTVVKNAVSVLRPKAVFCVGACSGLKNVRLGDVVVSSKLTTAVYKTPASRDIGTLIRHAADGWNAPLENPNALDVRVHCDGEVLSRPEGTGEDIIQRFPGAIAMEMEGEGVFAAAHDLKTEWVVVKGIKDFVDDSQPSSDEWGKFASVMAASVVANILSDPVIFEDWSHYNQGSSQDQTFDAKTCRSKLAEHYERTATVPTSVWSKKSPVDIHQIYTRLSWVKEEQTPAGSSQSKVSHYTDLFTANKNGVVPKRILVQGQTGIGKSTFVKKLAVDWAELDDKNTVDKQIDVLKQFELLVAVNLKEVSKYEILKDVIIHSSILPREEKHLTDSLLDYITNNQDKVLLVFDGYDEYRCGRNSEIYEIFKGSELRNCCVLITSRISKADELREFKDVHAEITGFSEEDREAFAKKKIGGEAEELIRHLFSEHLGDLTRVPLLLLFFCTLWKKEKLKSFPETKTNLYWSIVQHVLYYNQGKDSPARFDKVDKFKEILAEIGKVALECLLKDDHVFEYDQLSAVIRCEESLITGFIQVTEYAENLRPAGMVSFIHKSIQEFLAAWYIFYRCVPEGNLGGTEQHARTLEDCEALENVFQFICGLSEDGAVKVFQHFTSMRNSDPTLDLSKTIPDFENETDVPLCDLHLTDRQRRFIDVVFGSFKELKTNENFLSQEVFSRAKPVRHWFDCTGGIIVVTRPLHEFTLESALAQVTQSTVFFFVKDQPDLQYSIVPVLFKSLKCLERISQSSVALSVGNFLEKFQNVPTEDCSYGCGFNSVVCNHNGQFRVYITDMQLHCDYHAKLFTETITISSPDCSTSSCSDQTCLKYVRSLFCLKRLNGQTMKNLGSLVKVHRNWKSIELIDSNDHVCDLLEMVPNPGCCVLKIGGVRISCTGKCELSSAGAVKLASLLPRFNNISTLCLDLKDCCATAVNTLVSNITHRTLKILVLSDIRLSSAEASVLGRSLPHVALEILYLKGADGPDRPELQTEDIKALFAGFDGKKAQLCELFFKRFTVRGSLAPLFRRLRFFPNLKVLNLDESNVSERDMGDLLETFKSTPHLRNCICRVIGWPAKQ